MNSLRASVPVFAGFFSYPHIAIRLLSKRNSIRKRKIFVPYSLKLPGLCTFECDDFDKMLTMSGLQFLMTVCLYGARNCNPLIVNRLLKSAIPNVQSPGNLEQLKKWMILLLLYHLNFLTYSVEQAKNQVVKKEQKRHFSSCSRLRKRSTIST